MVAGLPSATVERVLMKSHRVTKWLMEVMVVHGCKL